MVAKFLRSAAGLAVLSVCAPATAAPPPASAFGRLPAIQDAEVSPNGERIAILGGPPTQRQVSIAKIDDPKVAILNMGRVITRYVRWVGDDYVIAKTQIQDPFFKKEVYNFQRDVVIDTNGKAIARLADPDDFNMLSFPVLRIIHGPKPAVYIATLVQSQESFRTNDTRMKGSNDDFTPAIRKLDVRTGRGSLSERAADDTDSWVLDQSGESRVRFDSNPDSTNFTILARAKDSSSWKSILRTSDRADLESFLGYSDPDDSVYFAERVDGAYSVIKVSLKTGARVRIGPSKPARAVDLQFDPYTGALIAIATTEESTVYQWLDPTLGTVHGKLSRALKGRVIRLANWSRDRTKFLAVAESPDSPAVWYLLDTAKGQLSPIAGTYPELSGQTFGTTTWITYKARDGLEIPAYLTMPAGVSGKAPLIVLPHGGPAARDNDGFDFMVQFLASRGYAVLRPQFRGSAGFGRAFEEAGHKEWAGKMQTDLIDGVQAVAAKGGIDPSRTCIVGASYGGYAALAGVAFNGQAYRCAVAIAPVTDLSRFMGDKRLTGQNDALAYWRTLLGRESGATVNRASPVRHAEQIADPVLMIHGKDDTTVKYEQSEAMVEAMKKAGKLVELVTLDGDDHHMSTSETRTSMLSALEAFLAKHNPAG